MKIYMIYSYYIMNMLIYYFLFDSFINLNPSQIYIAYLLTHSLSLHIHILLFLTSSLLLSTFLLLINYNSIIILINSII